MAESRIVNNEVIYVKASQLLPHELNWRSHPPSQKRALTGMLDEIGWVDAVKVMKVTKEGESPQYKIIDGHLRADVGGNTEVPVLVLDVTEEEAQKLLLTFDPIGMMAQTNQDDFLALLEQRKIESPDVNRVLEAFANGERFPLPDLWDTQEEPIENLKEASKKRTSRSLPIDAFYCSSVMENPPYCCIAAASGFQIGINSHFYNGKVCHYGTTERMEGRHKVNFIDTMYLEYNQAKHVETCEIFKPKYATVRDVMTRAQCHADEAPYYELGQILEWAEELEQHADNVIVIPKYDCIDQIPERYVLGYSIPTSHGGTPLPLEAFRGRRVHLLGGSWPSQLGAMNILGDDVVSLDNNYILKVASYGQYVDPDGTDHALSDVLGQHLNNPHITAFTLSVGFIAGMIKDMLGEELDDNEGNDPDIETFGEENERANH